MRFVVQLLEPSFPYTRTPLMQDLTKQVGRNYSVSCCVFNFDIPPHDLTQKEQAPEGVLTMLEAIQCAS